LLIKLHPSGLDIGESRCEAQRGLRSRVITPKSPADIYLFIQGSGKRRFTWPGSRNPVCTASPSPNLSPQGRGIYPHAPLHFTRRHPDTPLPRYVSCPHA